jgi:hypothetical protein
MDWRSEFIVFATLQFAVDQVNHLPGHILEHVTLGQALRNVTDLLCTVPVIQWRVGQVR